MLPEMTAPSARSIAPAILLVILLALSAAFLYADQIQLGYSADGAYAFSRVLEANTCYVPIWSRAHADCLLQVPLVLAARAGVTDFASLSHFYHLGLFLPFLLSLALCWLARRPGGNDVLMLFPFISYILVSLPAASHLSGQGQILAVLVWPVLFFLLKPRWSSLDVVLLLLLLLLLCRVYEAYLPSGLLFLVLLVQRVRQASAEERPALILALILVALGIGIAGYSAVFPDSVRNRHDFAVGMVRDVPRHPLLLASIAAVLALAAAVSVPRRFLAGMLPLLAGLGAIGLSASGRIATAGISFNSRSLTGTLLPLLLLIAVLVQRRQVRLDDRDWLLAGGTLVALITAYILSWSAWGDFRKDFVTVLDSRSGYVPVSETILSRNSQRWQWTSSILSILWSPSCVRTILVSQVPGWNPFDPRDSLPLQNRVRYQEAFVAASRHASHCP